MAHGNVTTNVPAELKSAAVNGVVASAEGIYDFNKHKTQETINQELFTAINNVIVTEDFYPE